MSQLRAAMWVHGTIVQVEYPKRLVSVDPDTEPTGFRRGWGTLFRGGDPNPVRASNWFHIPITTPVILDDVRPSLIRVFVFYNATSRARITNLHVYDGPNRKITFDNLVGYSGDHSTGIDAFNTWTITPPLTILFGLGISVGVNFGWNVNGSPLSDILFTTAGADFALGS